MSFFVLYFIASGVMDSSKHLPKSLMSSSFFSEFLTQKILSFLPEMCHGE